MLSLAACGSSSSKLTPDAIDATPTHALAMDDVSILLPLPADPSTPVLASITGDGAPEPLVSNGLFAALVLDPGDIAPKTGPEITYEQMQVVAVRLDLCDRDVVGPCDAGADGRLRLVLQPMYTLSGATAAQDIAIHVFYAIPASELGRAISQLRGLAAIQNVDPQSPLGVSPAAMAGDADYLAALRAFVLQYAKQSNLVRITLIGQVAFAGAFEWNMRGYNRDISYTPITIPGLYPADLQNALIAGGDITYLITPMADTPVGFALAVDGQDFGSATPTQQLGALAAIVQTENPLLHDNVDTQCAACHVAEYTGTYRANELATSLSALPGFYQTTRNVAVQSIADTDSRVIRAFGWIASQPVITRRVANATAEVLDEIDARFPP
ncbi:MAG TPA: hypothetical protein VMJ10_29710 [Kofleriaceae bacterium]|nr:hypothetical protein [Kofleriaceae bacterium]